MNFGRVQTFVAAVATIVTLSFSAASVADNADETAVKAVLASYNAATQRLDVSGTGHLFAADSEIIESGGVEGTFEHYLKTHIGPELQEFKTFSFSNYAVRVVVHGDFAFATESFQFRIEPKKGDMVERKAVATSVLRRADSSWKIWRYHWSSRRLEPAKN